jgi:hypothetical protein
MLVQLYEMATAMDDLYEFLFCVGEDWGMHVKAWLVRMLRQKLALPLPHSVLVKVILKCLQRENMMYSLEVKEIVGNVISRSIDFKSGNTNDSAGLAPTGNGNAGAPAGSDAVLQTIQRYLSIC